MLEDSKEENKSICFRSQLEKSIEDLWMLEQKSTRFLDELWLHLCSRNENYSSRRMKLLAKKLKTYLIAYSKNQNF